MRDFFEEYKIAIIICILCLLIAVISFTFSMYLYSNRSAKSSPSSPVILSENSPKEETDNEEVLAKFFIEVKGEVVNPGVYEVNANQIINDAITLAGGFKDTSYTDNINLSKSLAKEMVIYVYSKNEYKKLKKANEDLTPTTTCKCPDYQINDCTDQGSSIVETGTPSSNVASSSLDVTSGLININTAGKEELMTLTGIGDSKAENIIAYRTSHGKFQYVEEIQNVTGIGEAIYAQIKDHITI